MVATKSDRHYYLYCYVFEAKKIRNLSALFGIIKLKLELC